MKNKIILIVLSIVLFSCKKETVVGLDGENGKDGNANVISKKIPAGTWVRDYPDWVMTFNYNEITQDIVDNGVVLVYGKDGNGYVQLPISGYSGSISYNINFAYELNTVYIVLVVSNPSITLPVSNIQEYRIVVLSGTQLRKKPNLDFSNYNEVIKLDKNF